MSALEIEFTFESSFCLSSRDDRSSVRLQNASSRRILSECCWNCSKMNSSLKLLLFLVMSRSICNSQQYFILWLQQLKWKNQALIYCHGSGNNAWVRKSLSFQDIKEIKGMRHRNCPKEKMSLSYMEKRYHRGFFFLLRQKCFRGQPLPPRVVFTHERSEGSNWDPRG